MTKKHKHFTKSELIESVSKKHNTTKTMASVIVNSILDSIMQALKKGDRVEIRGFGTFELRKYDSYEGRNPQTGEIIHVKPKKLPFFKVGKFRNIINDHQE